jgi:sulfite exporter TauE/SafE
MCGGINLSQCLVQKPDGSSQAGWKPSLLYNGGRVISYTLIGGIVGALGAVISFSGAAKGIVAILAGLFMVVMGINMLGLIPALRRFQIRMPEGIRTRLMGKSGERGPFVVGLLNGLMPCGPLQTMQLYALGTGSALAGALSMLVFSLGTVPLMFGFGAISTLLSKKFTRSVLRFSAALVVILGLIMMQRGFNLGGMQVFGLTSLTQKSSESVTRPGDSSVSNDSTVALNDTTSVLNDDKTAGSVTTPTDSSDAGGVKTEDGVQVVQGEVKSRSYPAITVKKGVPVKFNMHAGANSLNGCNGTVVIPEFNIEQKLQPGDNILEFTPLKAGTIGYTCWMGMISSTITVVD